MLKLIELEWRKGNIVKFIRYVVIMAVVLLSFLIATAGTAGADATSMGLYEKSVINAAVELYTNMTYIVFTGVMLASFILGEYERGTISLMFSYPIKRRDIMMAKIYAVWIFNVVALIFNKILIYVVLLIVQPFSFMAISAQDIPFGSLMFWFDMIISSIIMISVAYFALPLGLKMKSSRVIVIVNMLIAFFSSGNNGVEQGYILYVFLIALTVLIIFLSIRNIEIDDVI